MPQKEFFSDEVCLVFARRCYNRRPGNYKFVEAALHLLCCTAWPALTD